MKKLVIALVMMAMIAAVAVPQAFGAITDTQKKKVDDLHAQIMELRKQVIATYVEAGELTQEQADAIIKRMEEKEKLRAEKGFIPGKGRMGDCGNCDTEGGKGGRGCGKRGGFGRGMMAPGGTTAPMLY